LLATRINEYFKRIYSTDGPNLPDIFTKSKNINDPVKYILDRTLMRPRDAISFLNICISMAEGKSKIGHAELIAAEKEYSEGRIQALSYEWGATYPNLSKLVIILRKFPKNFKFDYLLSKKSEIETGLIDCVISLEPKILESVKTYATFYARINDNKNGLAEPAFENVCTELLRILFEVGVIGIKTSTYDGVRWSYEDQTWTSAEMDASPTFTVQPTFWMGLAITD